VTPAMLDHAVVVRASGISLALQRREPCKTVYRRPPIFGGHASFSPSPDPYSGRSPHESDDRPQTDRTQKETLARSFGGERERLATLDALYDYAGR
jgi:hypothetical protein